MSLWSTIVYKIKEVLSKMLGARTIEQTLHVAPTISSEMENAIQLWTDMYKNKAPWLKEPDYNDPSRIVSLGLPSMIASEKARTALIELKSEITIPGEEDTAEADEFTKKKAKTRAGYLNDQYKKLKKKLRTQIEYGIAKGGLIIKPYIVANKSDEDQQTAQTYTIEWDFCQADSFYPIAFNSCGDITEAVFLQSVVRKDVIYRRLEYHKWDNNTVVIMNKAYKSTNSATLQDNAGIDLGQEVSLKEIPEWKDLQPETKIKNVTKPLFGYFKMPDANTIDTSSPLGVSGYSRAVDLIKDADMQYSRLLWEYEGGELAIDIDRDALQFVETGVGKDGRPNARSVLSSLQQRLYRKVDIGMEGDTYQPYAPNLRDSSYLAGLNNILMRIEDVCALSRGTLSDATQEAKTATELKILKQRSYQANVDIQQAIQDAIESAVYAANAYCTLYQITSEGEYDISFEWDDSIIVDVDTELNKRLSLMQQGLASKLELRMWYYGETERQAKEALKKIDEENKQSMEEKLMMESQFSEEDDE